MNKPLAGIRVLDLSRILAGPWCTQHLADMGADVIKVEHPERGDDTRGWGPPYLDGTQDAAYYLSANRGKRSIAVDIAQMEGQALIRELVSSCDVVLENFKVGGLKRYGLDYESLKEVKPDLIYCSITGFGQNGPYSKRAGYDFLLQGMGGLMDITGRPDGEPGAEPMKVGVAVVDLFTGMYAATSILSALLGRNQTGEGAWIDIALMDVQVSMLANQAMNYLTSGQSPKRMGNSHPNIVPYQAFATADGHIILAVGNDGQFQRFCEVAGVPLLASDERFATNRSRVQNRKLLVPQLERLLAEKPSAYWLEALEREGVPCGPINTIEQVFEDPQVQFRGMKMQLSHAEAGSVDLVSNPIRFNDQSLNADAPPPGLGEHTQAVLSELFPDRGDYLEKLKKQGVIR
ncbi:CaiB/BaiF CoA transferase family protein [Marinobacter oulmenensis]|uniref:Crotonobetainyl-CoA:carnitine CoA-transferase CaiB-like acyl-CoA transferase n=1 Tax=Marinobacter oulmenensis TaxID=643747 RepID=A0A840UJE6_9GAMM|nr:CaiB/BaiF CoA-transferase family protein [Marinobacter oulmenensis]MBB5320927.1 crotonobetainyl-CoA:carnitine CoA-transferase CaiB-like acyl-CoA transferase [Marinobacter oulmenensis]